MVRRIISLIDSFDSFIWFINNEFKSKITEYKFINYYKIFYYDETYILMNFEQEKAFWNFILLKFKEKHGNLFEIYYKPQEISGDLFIVKLKS